MYLNQDKKLKYHLVLRSIIFIFAVFVGFSMFSCNSAEAATRTWKGTTSNLWSVTTNWNEGIIPVAGDDLVFPTPRVSSNYSTSNNIAADTSFNSITINASGYTLAGNRITLAGAFTDNSASSTNAVSLAIILDSTQTFSVASGVTTTISGIISGAGGVTKSGSGTLKLSGANTYQGLTTVDVGILRLAHNTGLGTTDAATTVTDGAQLYMDASLTVTEALTINGTGISSTGALINATSTSTWSGAITLGSAAQIQTNGSMGLTVSGGITGTNTDLTLTSTGSISSGGMTISTNIIDLGTGQLIKTGAGKVTIGTANTYTGDTTVLNGYLLLSAAAPSGSAGTLGNSTNAVILGDTSGTNIAGLLVTTAVTVARDITVRAGSSGKAWIGGGAAANSTLSGNIALSKDVYLTAYGSSSSATLSGVISGGYNVIINSPSTSHNGYVALTGTNTYTGDTSVVANAMLKIGAAAPSGSNGALGNSTNAVTLCPTSGTIATTVYISGAFTVARGFTVQAGSSGVMTFKGANSAVYSGNIALSKAATLSTDASSTVTFSGVISGDYAVTASPSNSSGSIVLSNSNSYTGGTTINGGSNGGSSVNISNASALGTGAVTVSNFGSLKLSGNIDVGNIALTLNGVGSSTANSGALYNTSGTNSWAGAITLASATNFYSTAGSLTLTGGMTGTDTNISFKGAGAITINTNGFSIGSGTLTAAATPLTLNTANTYTGATTLSAGSYTMIISTAAALGSTPSVTTGGAHNLKLTGGIAVGNIPLSLNTGIFTSDSGNNSWAGAITFASGYWIICNADTLTLTGGITAATNANLYFDGSGNIVVNTVGITTGTGTLRKEGTGKLTIAAASTYSGAISLNAGTLNLQNDTAAGTTTNAITVASGAALELQGGITVGAKPLTLNNTGVSSGGALRNISGNNSYAGAITLASNNVRINSDADTMTLTGGITGSLNLTVGGSGNVTIGTSGVNTGASKTLTKDGAGTLTISASGNYTGLTTVSAGVLNVQHATATGTTAGGVTVTAGAAVQMQGGITVGAEALTLNGTGISNDGALRNISGNNTWENSITLGSASRINSDGDLLTLSGGITGNTLGLTVGGAGTGNVTISGIISTTTGTLGYDGGGTLILSAANTYTGLTTISGGTLAYGIAEAVKAGNSITISAGGSLDLAGYAATTTTIDNSGTLKIFADEVTGAITNNSGSVVKYYGVSGPYTLKNLTYYGLWLASASATTYSLPADLTINANLTIAADNTLDAVNGNDYDINIKGNWTNNGVFTARSGIVTFSSTTAAQTLSGTMTGGSAFSTLILTNTYGTADPGCAVSYTPGIIFAADATATNYTITTGNVKVQYNTGSTYTFTNINWNGNGVKIYFRNSALDSGTWLLNVSGTQTAVSYVDVARSNAGSGSAIAASDGTNTNCLNNTNWSFTAGALSVSIVNADGNDVVSPAMAMGSINFAYLYQTATGSFGTASEKIRVTNTSANPQWTLSLDADGGATALWSAGTPKYDFNDPTASAGDGGDADSVGGQMTLTASAGTLTPQGGCSNDNLLLASAASFSEDPGNAITLITANGSAQTSCYWDLTGVGISQTIPALQTAGNYSINMTLTAIAY